MGATSMRGLALLFVVGCGDVPAKKVDAAVTPTDAPDMTIDSNMQLGPWQTPTPIASINTASDERGPWLSADGLTIYFVSDRAGGQGSYDIYRATRTSMTTAFGTAQNVTALNTTAAEASPFVAASGARIWFGRTVSGQGSDIFVATGSGGNWGTPVAVAELNTVANDSSPMVTANGDTMYLFSRRGANNDGDIYVATYNTTTSMWSAPTTATVAAVNSALQDYYPFRSNDGLRLYLLSDRAGQYGAYVATRTSPTADFGAATAITELNTLVIDGGIWVSADERYMIFSANNDLYETVR